MNVLKKGAKKERPKLIARPQADFDVKAASEELNKRYAKTLEYLAR